MNRLLFFCCLYFLTICCNAQQKRTQELKVIRYISVAKQFLTNGAKDEIGADIRIAFYKDFTLYEIPTDHYVSPPEYIDFENTKDGDTITSDALPEFEKRTYEYFIAKNGQKTGLSYDNIDSPSKKFFVDTLFKYHGLDTLNEQFVNTEFGKPTNVIKQGKTTLEKFYNINKKDFPDTAFRYYDSRLKDLGFSISKHLDQLNQSKLYKSVFLYKTPYSPSQTIQSLKLELICEFSLVTNLCSKRDLELFQQLFSRFIEDAGKPE